MYDEQVDDIGKLFKEENFYGIKDLLQKAKYFESTLNDIDKKLEEVTLKVESLSDPIELSGQWLFTRNDILFLR